MARELKKRIGLDNNGAGFTLIEILLIVAIFAIILSSAISLTTTQVFESDLEAKSLEVASMIEKARSYSATGYRGDVWSIKVLNDNALCTNSGDCILLFKGRTFSGRDTSYDRFVQFDQSISGVYLNADQANEFYFAYKSGWLATTTASYLEQQNIVLNSNIGNQKSIVIQPSGVSSIFVCGEDKVFDINGHDYTTVKIGTQCWMAENLNTGTMLATGGTPPTDNSIIEKWCYANIASNCDLYGGLYQWDEMMGYITTESTQGICPGGWHLPSNSQLATLEANFSTGTDGYQMKLGGQSGFDLPFNGERNIDGSGSPVYFDSSGSLAIFWSSTESASEAYAHYVQSGDTMTADLKSKSFGFSVRCLKDY